MTSYALTPLERANAVEEEEFIGKAINKWRDRRQVKKDDRHAKKLEKIRTRQDAKTDRVRLRADSRVAGGGGGFGSVFGGIAQSLLGGGGMQPAPAPTMDPAFAEPYAEEPKDNSKMYIIAGVVLVIVVVAGIYLSRKKNS